MRASNLWFVPLGCLGFAACAQGGPAVDVTAETDALRQTELAYQEAASALDADRVSEFYATDAVMYPPNDARRSGLDAIREFAAAFTSAPGLQMDWDLVEVSVGEGGTMGYTRTEGVVTVTGPDGEPLRQRVNDMHVWEKDATGEWKLTVDIWNSPDPMPGG
ncbi:MAG TPA: DUF4440 domain-containing protein [Longimicrobiales bacterium]|nr:DUF4440 domain-containing protein [Longimicrobiales bacterium]